MKLSSLDHPKLSAKTRLRWDPREKRYFLLYPERGLALNGAAAEIAKLCSGALSVGAIVETVASAHPEKPRSEIESDVLGFLEKIRRRGLLEIGG